MAEEKLEENKPENYKKMADRVMEAIYKDPSKKHVEEYSSSAFKEKFGVTREKFEEAAWKLYEDLSAENTERSIDIAGQIVNDFLAHTLVEPPPEKLKSWEEEKKIILGKNYYSGERIENTLSEDDSKHPQSFDSKSPQDLKNDKVIAERIIDELYNDPSRKKVVDYSSSEFREKFGVTKEQFEEAASKLYHALIAPPSTEETYQHSQDIADFLSFTLQKSFPENETDLKNSIKNELDTHKSLSSNSNISKDKISVEEYEYLLELKNGYVGKDAKLFMARENKGLSSYTGVVFAETAPHLLQKISDKTVIVHEKVNLSGLSNRINFGESVKLTYTRGKVFATDPNEKQRQTEVSKEIKDQILKQFGEDTLIYHAKTDQSKYAGKIVAETDSHYGQQIGANVFILHDRSKFEAPLEKGKSITIQYANQQSHILDKSKSKTKEISKGLER